MLDNRREKEPQKGGSEADPLKVFGGPTVIEIGQVVATPGAVKTLKAAGVELLTLTLRHQRGDWGDLDHDYKKANDRSLVEESRVLSSYNLPGTNDRVWILTEADRSVTTLLLPEEY